LLGLPPMRTREETSASVEPQSPPAVIGP
jgi:hypothetical protein